MATNFMRAKVSKKKRRYIDKKEGFDLDLSYITPNIIAMGFPSEGVEGAYRNPYSEVIRFLDLKHKNAFKIYNLCSERGYDAIKFYNRVGLYPFDDHNAPPFELIERFCIDVKEFLDQDENNLAVVHCKAGKGRTGLMICCYLIYTNEWNSAAEAMAFYAAMRTYNKKGVTIPSQIRYIHYFERYRKFGIPYSGALLINRIVVHGIPNMHSKGAQLGFIVSTFGVPEIFSYKEKAKKEKEAKKKKSKGKGEDDDLEAVTFECNNLSVTGDIKITLIERSATLVGRMEESPMCWFWFNTAFIDNCYLNVQQSEVDKANKDKNNKTFPKGFHVEVFFSLPEVDATAASTSTSSSASSSSAPAASAVEAGSTSAAALPSASSAAAVPPLNSSGSVKFSSLMEQNGEETSAPDVTAASVVPEPVIEEATLNRMVLWNDKAGHACKVAQWLLSELISLVVLAADQSGELHPQSEAFSGLKLMDRFRVFVMATAELQRVEIKSLSASERTAFWLNVINTMLLHSFIVNGIPKSRKQRAVIQKNMSYEIDGRKYSINDIEHAILRSSMAHPEFIDGVAIAYPKSKRFRDVVIETPDPRINFAIAHGTASSPRLQVFSAEGLEDQLEENTHAFLANNIEVDPEGKVITLPKILSWYQEDFGSSVDAMLKRIATFIPDNNRENFLESDTKFEAKFTSYNWSFYYNLRHMLHVPSSLAQTTVPIVLRERTSTTAVRRPTVMPQRAPSVPATLTPIPVPVPPSSSPPPEGMSPPESPHCPPDVSVPCALPLAEIAPIDGDDDAAVPMTPSSPPPISLVGSIADHVPIDPAPLPPAQHQHQLQQPLLSPDDDDISESDTEDEDEAENAGNRSGSESDD